MSFVSSLLKGTSGFVLLLAVLVGVIGQLAPHLFMKIPKVGFIFHAISGGEMPPYFDSSAYSAENFPKWTSDGDVIIATGAKAGTYLTHNMVALLKDDGWDEWRNMFDRISTAEVISYPGQSIHQRVELVAEKRANVSLRRDPALAHFSHFCPAPGRPGMDPKANPTIKYIATFRNGKEVVRSLLGFINGHSDKFKELWGGFPPPLGGPEAALKFATEDIPGLIFGFATAWWEVRHLPNVLLLHYSDIVKDKEETVKKVAKFLNIPLSKELLKTVVLKTSFEYMQNKEAENPHHYTSLWGYPGDKFRYLNKDAKHMARGRADGGEGFFTSEMDAAWEAAVKKYFGGIPGLAEWVEQGGPLPRAA